MPGDGDPTAEPSRQATGVAKSADGAGGAGASGAPAPANLPPVSVGGSFSEVLEHRHFRNVLFAQFFSNVGGWMEMFAIQMFIAKATGRLDDQGTLGALSGLPIFFLGVFGGVVADRVNRRNMLVVTQLLAAFVAVGVAVVSMYPFEAGSRAPIHWLFALAAINGVVMAFNFPAWQVLTPRLVPRPLLTRAITLNGIQFNMARVVGPALAGLILAHFASTPVFILNAVSFVVVAIVVARTPPTPVAPVAPTALPANGAGSARANRSGAAFLGLPLVMHQVGDAWRFIWRSRGPWAVFWAQVYISLLAAPLVRVLSLFVIDVYQVDKERSEAAAGYLLAIQGVGAVAGGLCLRLIPPWYPKHHFIPLAIASLGASISLFAAVPNLWLGYGAMLVVGFFWIWSFNQSWAAMQVLAPEAMRGRVLSLVTTASFGATALGVYSAGLLGEFLKRVQVSSADPSAMFTPGQATQLVVAALGVPLFFGGIYMLLNRTPEVDNLPRISGLDARRRFSLVHAVLATEHRPPRDPVDANADPSAEATRSARGG